MSSTLRSLTFAVLALGASSIAFAQDGEGPKAPPAPAPARPMADPADLLQQMLDLYPRVLRDPFEQTAAPSAGAPGELSPGQLQDQWRKAASAMVKAGDDYVLALADAAPDARGLYLRGFAHAKYAARDGAANAPGHYEATAESLQRFLDASDETSEFRGDAERWLGTALLHLKKPDDAVVHLGRAVDLYQRAGRHDDAGRAAYDAMMELLSGRRQAELRAFGKAIHAEDGDFGTSTPSIRKLLAAARLSVGAPLPSLPAVKDVTGAPISWTPGRPLLVHFFLAGHLTGLPSNFREIETEVRPLFTKYAEKGLAVVGVSMDYEIPKSQAETTRKNWEEWGRKTEFRDGSLESVRGWAAKQGVEWPWYWDGKATLNPVSVALGGVGVTSPYAVLVDKDGVVRWFGGAPFEGLADEAAKLLP